MGSAERREHNERGVKRLPLENQNSDAISELYVSHLINPASKFFYDDRAL